MSKGQGVEDGDVKEITFQRAVVQRAGNIQGTDHMHRLL